MSRPAMPELTGPTPAEAAALLFALDPHGFAGIIVRGRPGPARERYLRQIRGLFPPDAPWRRLPAGMPDERLDGGLDLAATLALGRPVRQPGLMAESNGGVVVIPGAERLSPAIAARLGVALDTGATADGRDAARFGLLALDEGLDDEALPHALADRLAFQVEPTEDDAGALEAMDAGWLAQARQRLDAIVVEASVRDAIAAAAVAFGIGSLRPALAALRAARSLAALDGRQTVSPDDAALAARLVLAHRATQVPAAPEASAEQSEPSQAETSGDASSGEKPESAAGSPDETVREAVRTALPPGLLLGLNDSSRAARQAPGRSGAVQAATTRGRPAGLRSGVPRGGARLNLIETLRAAAPWQPLRRPVAGSVETPRRIEIRRSDLRLTRFKQRTETVTLFAVDASGSLALQRLHEAKGAVELLLAECYVRRDQVALLAFRGTAADLLLPPTRSLARAKRCLAHLAGGGATPLATALDSALALGDGIRRRGRTPVIVVLTDGRANITRDGAVDRRRAEAEARDAARALAFARLRTLLIDAAPRPQASARALADAMSAIYLPLPRAEATGLTRAIRQAATP